MTQIFTGERRWVPVTVVKAGPCTVVQKKIGQKEGYSAVQIGFLPIDPKKLNKPQKGHFASKKVEAYKILREFRTLQVDMYQPGDKLTVENFQMGDVVQVSGLSKGKGFQGVMKRHHFAGGRDSHGCSISHRSPGSIGQRTYPGKVFKGKRMAGQMGNEKVTVKNLRIVGIEAQENLLLIRGAVPGANHSLVVIRPCSHEFEERILKKQKSDGNH